VDETATQHTGVLAGNGTLTVDIKDINKTSIGVDYQDEDRLKVKLQSSETVKLFADESLTLSGGIGYNVLNKTITGNAGINFEVSKDIKMSFDQSFNKSGNAISGKITFSF
jgi:hypothetical protein